MKEQLCATKYKKNNNVIIMSMSRHYQILTNIDFNIHTNKDENENENENRNKNKNKNVNMNVEI